MLTLPCFLRPLWRSLKAAVKQILDDFPDAAGKIEVLQIDVTDDASCAAAAAALKVKGLVTLIPYQKLWYGYQS